MSHPLTAPLIGFAGRLKFPTLFFVTAGLFLLDVLIPDLIPFADELLLGLGTLLLASWQRQQPDKAVPPSVPPASVIEGESRRE